MGMWTDRCRPLIAAVLDALPAGATREECRKALSEAYPFGPREHHPYRVWLRECRESLDRRFADRPSGEPPVVRVELVAAPGPPRLEVRCGWCDATPLPSCLMCGPSREKAARLSSDRLFAELLRASAADPVAARAAADLMEEATGLRPERRSLYRGYAWGAR